MTNSSTNQDEAAREAAEVAVKRAKEVSSQVITSVSLLDRGRLVYLAAMGLVVVCILIFDIASFSVGTDYAVSETQAQAQRDAQAQLNSWSYSAFSSTFWGKLAWLAAIGGVGLVIFEAVQKSTVAWVPLAQIGCAALATLLMLLLFVVGFPDLSAYSDVDTSATLFGYWLPLAAAITALVFSVKRLT